MRVFTTICIDKLTNMQMILSECSFNEACSHLESVQEKYNLGKYLGTECMGKNTTKIKFANDTFYYDEERGYLLRYTGEEKRRC